jgi:hypothetical protein
VDRLADQGDVVESEIVGDDPAPAVGAEPDRGQTLTPEPSGRTRRARGKLAGNASWFGANV